MAERGKKIQVWGYVERILTDEAVAEKGNIACADRSTGLIDVVSESETLIPIGYFEQNLTGDGVKKVRIKLFKELELHMFDNDSAPNALDLTDFLGPCYLKDGKTVSALATDRSFAGRVWDVTTEGVLIEPAVSIGLQGPQGEPG